MAKRKFIKSIQKSSPFKKLSVTFISLALLFVISIVLYFVFNKYSIENFTPKANAKIEVMLWTDDEGSVNNDFVTGEWLNIASFYDKFAKFDKGDFAGFKSYIQNGVRGTDKEAEVTDEKLEPFRQILPVVTVSLIVDNKFTGVNGDIAFYTCDTSTGVAIKTEIAKHLSKNYNKLFSNSTPSTPSTSSTPSTPSTPPMT